MEFAARVDPPRERGSRQKRLCLLGLFLAWGVGYADRFVMNTAIIPISQKFSLGPQQAGILLSAFHLTNFGGQLGGVVAPSAAGLLVAAYGGSFTGSFGLFLSCAALSVLVSLTWHRGTGAAGPADI